jgi:hypothetical protein
MIKFLIAVALGTAAFSWTPRVVTRSEDVFDRAPPPDTTDSIAPHRITILDVNGHVLEIPYFRNHDITENTNCRRAVILIHGKLRNADDYWSTLQATADTADSADMQDSLCILIAPQFLTEAEIDSHNLDSTHLYWSYGGWQKGNLSLDTPYVRPAQISSFAVMDTILAFLARRNSYLDTIVIAGHSAGAQMVVRYAAGSPMEDELSGYGIHFRYVSANPSNYLYMDSVRVVPGTLDSFAIPPPETIAACPEYNEYKYGLDSLYNYSYMGQPKDSVRNRYYRRWLMYLLGDADTLTDNLDTSCQANIQGVHRYERGIVYYNYLDYYYGSSVHCRHIRATVQGVSHKHDSMYTSPCGVFALFDVGHCTPISPQCMWVEFSYSGTEEGSFFRPYNSVAEGVSAVPIDGTVIIKSGTSPETLSVNKKLDMRSWNGTSTIGAP